MRFGILGNGRIAERHKRAIEAIGGKLVAMFDPACLKEENACRSSTEMFYKDFDWVVIASPTYCHYGQVKEALGHNRKVICEKPYVLPWQPVVDSDNVFVVLQLRWLDLPPTAKRIVIRASRNMDYFASWKGDPLLTGGLFFDLFIHYVDLARRYRCKLDLMVSEEGEQERRIDDFDLMGVDMDKAYERMYRDMVLRNRGVRPRDVAELHWLLGRYTERFGSGKDILGKNILVSPDGLV